MVLAKDYEKTKGAMNIKNCPYCRGKPRIKKWAFGMYDIFCKCLSEPRVRGTNRETAIEIWNRGA